MAQERYNRTPIAILFSIAISLLLTLSLGRPGVAAEGADALWFWPDPFPGLGHESIEGDGWMYLRIAADEGAGRDIGLSDAQRKEMQRCFEAAQMQERDLARQRRAAEVTDMQAWAKQRRKLWQGEAGAASSLLSVKHDRRIKQLLLQRLSFNAFSRDDVAEFVDLNDEQRSRIATAIDAHLQRLEIKDTEIDALIGRLGGLHGEPLQDRVNELKALVDARSPFGRQSHQQVWTEIRDILSPEQRDAFNSLRGPLPEEAAHRLQAFGR